MAYLIVLSLDLKLFCISTCYLGTIGLLWSIIWWIVVYEGPEEDPYISKTELQYIKGSINKSQHNANIKHPWKSILLSTPVWAIVFSHFAENWGFYTLITQLPKYLNGKFREFNLC